MSRSNIDYLRHALDEIEFLETQTQSLSENQFMLDNVLDRAFARSLEIIGEAMKCIPDATRKKYPDIDWKSYAGLRDKLIHHYFGVDYGIVWDVVKNELPDLKKKILQILADKQ